MLLRTPRKVPKNENHVSSCWLKPARQWWYHHQISHNEDEVGVKEEEVTLSQEWRRPDTYHDDGIRTTIKTRPIQPPFLPPTCYQEREISSPNSRLDRFDRRSDKQTRLKQQSCLPFPHRKDWRAYCKNWCFSQPDSQISRAQQLPFPSLFLSSIGWRRRKISQPSRTIVFERRKFSEVRQIPPHGLPYL